MYRLIAGRLTRGMSSPTAVLAAAAALSAAAVGGLFFAFSTFVMRGLNGSGPAVAVAAMRGINDEAQGNAPFLAMFFGSAVLALALGVTAAVGIRQPGSGWLLAGAVLAMVPIGVTAAVNVPLNDGLATVELTGLSMEQISRIWQDYFQTWTRWNHLRTVAPLLGSVLMVIGLRLR